MTLPGPVHLSVTGASELEEENVFCPVKKELTRLFLGKSADGMEVYACAACREPEPVIREVTRGAINAVYSQFHRDQ